uniref:Protein kinase domain-containing protein n=1 Tax=Strigamia maritima TaxID=126957 RepID=T1IP06_STRMM
MHPNVLYLEHERVFFETGLKLVEWIEFSDCVRELREDRQFYYENVSVFKDRPPIDTTRALVYERDLHDLLEQVWKSNLKGILNIGEVVTKGAREDMNFNRIVGFDENTNGDPDLVIYDRLGKKNLLIIEVKRPWKDTKNESLKARYEEKDENGKRHNNKVYQAVNQLNKYLTRSGHDFGLLTNREKTWCIKKEKEEKLLRVSEPVDWCDLTDALIFMTTIGRKNKTKYPEPKKCDTLSYILADGGAEQDRNDRGPPNIKKRKLKDSKESSTSETRSSKKAIEASFKILECLGEGRSGVTYESTFNGQPVAIKTTYWVTQPELKEEMFNEIRIYEQLKASQGFIVPKVLFEVFTANRKGFGMQLGHKFDPTKLTESQKYQIIIGLDLIHRHGVAHGDIKLDNVVTNRDKDGFWFIDFGFSKSNVPYECEELRGEKYEMRRLLGLEE